MVHQLDSYRYDAEYFPNLKRLNIYNDEGRSEGMFNGPKLEKCDEFYGFEFMNFCPASESAYLLLKSNKHIVSTSTVNYNMRDLVLIYVGKASFKAFYSPIITTDAIMSFISFAQQSGCEQEWNSLRTNAISHIKTLTDARKSLDFIQHLTEKHNRTIRLYYNLNGKQMAMDLPHISLDKDCIVKEFYYMRHCLAKKLLISHI
uniref:Uncharacterized protein n=1 Tax=Tetranychus urticae TaxID=32264 RepID=T1JX80_TETUR